MLPSLNRTSGSTPRAGKPQVYKGPSPAKQPRLPLQLPRPPPGKARWEAGSQPQGGRKHWTPGVWGRKPTVWAGRQGRGQGRASSSPPAPEGTGPAGLRRREDLTQTLRPDADFARGPTGVLFPEKHRRSQGFPAPLRSRKRTDRKPGNKPICTLDTDCSSLKMEGRGECGAGAGD